MSCWVVPSVAAEVWGVPVEQILQRIEDGQIATREDLGRMFVDVAPNSPTIETPRTLRPPTPPTYTVLTKEEAAALAQELEVKAEAEGDEQSIDLGDWREARDIAEKRRRPPLAA